MSEAFFSKQKTVFTSPLSYEEAEYRAKQNGYFPVGRGMNKKGYVVFAVKQI